MYIYAFLCAPDQPLKLPPGIISTLELIGCDRLAAVVEAELLPEAIRMADEEFQIQAILMHDRVLRDLFQQVEILPVPFGTFLMSRDGLLEYLKAHHSEYLDKLEQLQHHAEYTLKLIPLELTAPESSGELKGKEYFLAKKQRYQQQAEQQQQQHSQLEQTIAAIAETHPHWVQGEPKNGIERIFLLGDRRQEVELLQQLQNWREVCSLWELHLSEALPPYHFV